MRGCLALVTISVVMVVSGCLADAELLLLDPPASSPAKGRENPPVVAVPGNPITPPEGREWPLAICSELDFTGVTWPPDFTAEDANAMALALNVSGSFEGNHGWSNLSNNFDGQGLSMGLLQQNLGQGSIQPLLLRMLDQHRQVMADAMSPSMLSSLEVMLNEWKRQMSLLPHPVLESFVTEDSCDHKSLVDFKAMAGHGDIDKNYGVNFSLAPHNAETVEWALENVFTSMTGKYFKPEWQAALKRIAGDPTYISLQIEAARDLHERALGYQSLAGFTELRGYIFLFDIAVQNGYLRSKHFDQFFAWRAQNPTASEEEQMLELLEIRVVDSNPLWQDDVRKRKRAAIRGVGTVHGRQRQLQNEYCYDQTDLYP